MQYFNLAGFKRHFHFTENKDPVRIHKHEDLPLPAKMGKSIPFRTEGNSSITVCFQLMPYTVFLTPPLRVTHWVTSHPFREIPKQKLLEGW